MSSLTQKKIRITKAHLADYQLKRKAYLLNPLRKNSEIPHEGMELQVFSRTYSGPVVVLMGRRMQPILKL